MSLMKNSVNFKNGAILFIVVALTFQACGPFLVNNNKTDFKIVLSDSPDLVEQTAAKELKTYLDEITKANWIIASEKDVSEDAPQILIGNSSRAKKIFPEIHPDKIPYDGIEIHLKKNKLLLTGHKQRGTLYAVNTFLEDILGVRWWTSSEQTVPTYETFRLKPISISQAPKLIYRESFYKDAFDPLFASRMKCNGANERISPEYGGYHSFVFWVHSFYRLIPPEKYFADHPEWFSEVNGVRNAGHGSQLCLTNDEMRKELAKNAIEELRNNPGAKFISISQNDGALEGGCHCEKCKKILEEEESESGPLVNFVNAVAEEIEKEFPDVFVETLAYRYTRKPPKNVKPRKNVVIRLCTIECSFVQPLTGEQNKSLLDDIQGWGKIAHQLFVWDYITNFYSYILPHPNLRTLAPNVRFFVDHGTIGLFEQGDAHCSVGDFVRLRNWLISHSMWNPKLDEKKLIQEFLSGYYGNGAMPFLLEYFDVLLNKAESSGKFIDCYQINSDAWLDYETLCKATTLFDKAIAAAEKESGEFVERLRRERLPLDLVWQYGYHKYKRIAENKGEIFSGPADPEQLCKNFFEICNKYQVITHWEDFGASTSPKFAYFKDGMFRRARKPHPIPDEFGNINTNNMLDIQDYDFWWGPWSTLVSVVDDQAASDGGSVMMSGAHSSWGATIPIPIYDPLFEDIDTNTKFKIFAYVRCDATAKDGLAMSCGVYDQKEREFVVQKDLSVSEIAGSKYQKIEFEPISLHESMSIFFAPPKREDVQAIFIDRVLIVKIDN